MSINRSPTIIDELEDRNNELFVALDGEDDLGIVIRAHIHIEHELKEFILTVAPKPDQIHFPDYQYDGLLTLALTLGLSGELKPVLSAIGNLRNKFAHRLDMALTKHEANNLYRALSAEVKSDAHLGYANLKRMPKYANAGLPKSMRDLSPRRLFGTCVVTLRSFIILQTLKAYARSIGLESKAL
jgi:hypothetical protein